VVVGVVVFVVVHLSEWRRHQHNPHFVAVSWIGNHQRTYTNHLDDPSLRPRTRTPSGVLKHRVRAVELGTPPIGIGLTTAPVECKRVLW
jgi:hypothetical protein